MRILIPYLWRRECMRHSASLCKQAIVRPLISKTNGASCRFHPYRGHHDQQLPSFPLKRTIVTVTKTTVTTGDDVPMMPTNGGTSESTRAPLPQVTTTTATATSHSFVNITPSCTNRILQLARKKNIEPSELYLRIYVDAGGCSGFQYKFEIRTKQEEPLDEEEDVEFLGGGTSVVIDTASLDLIQGSTIDFVQEMIRSSFAVLDNPVSESACGCGSSFAVKNFAINPAKD